MEQSPRSSVLLCARRQENMMVEYQASRDPITGDSLKNGTGKLIGLAVLFFR
jgi:hypothetical protein